MHTQDTHFYPAALRLQTPRASRLRCAMAVMVACLCALASAQPADTAATGTETVIGVHYQDLLPTDGDTVRVFLPRPQAGAWDGLALSSSHECAVLGELGDPGPDHVLILEVTLTGPTGVLAPGESCSATIDASYRSGDTAWVGATLFTVNRLAAPPVPDGIVSASLTLDRIGLPFGPGARPLGSLITLTLTNSSAEPFRLLGLADQQAFAALIGSVYQYEEPFGGTLEGLESVGRALEPTTLAPGETTSIALVLDPGSRLPDGSSVLTVQPGLLVSVGGTTYALRFERLTTARGNELP